MRSDRSSNQSSGRCSRRRPRTDFSTLLLPCLNLETLSDRIVPSAAFFDPNALGAGLGELRVVGDSGDNLLTIQTDTQGNFVITDETGMVPIVGPTATLANTAGINVSGLNGNDTIILDEPTGVDFPPASLAGNSGDDSLVGASAADTLRGQEGDDTLVGGAGSDFLDGGDGRDILVGGADADSLIGAAGDDQLQGDDGNDSLVGGDGDDRLSGGNDNDTLQGDDGNDQLNSGPGDDFLRGGNDNDTLAGELGNDDLNGDLGDDHLDGGDGDDMVFGVAQFTFEAQGVDAVIGGLGADTLCADGADTLVQEPEDTLCEDPGNVTPPVIPPVPPTVIPRYAVGAGEGGAPLVQVYDENNVKLTSFLAFDESFRGGVRVAVGELTGDAIPDIIVGSGPGIRSQVLVFDGETEEMLQRFEPFESTFLGGTFVSAGDIDGDGMADIVITPDQGGGPRARIYNGATGEQIFDFFGIDDPDFRGGARGAIGDMNGDGNADLAVSAGFLGGPRMALWDGQSLVNGASQRLVGDFFVFEQTLRNGSFVTLGDLDEDGQAELIVGGGPTGGPRVRAFSGQALLTGSFDPIDPGLTAGVQLANFFAGDIDNRGGIRLASEDLDGDGAAELIAGAGTDAKPQVTIYSGLSLVQDDPPDEIDSFLAFEESFTGGLFVG